MKQKKLDDGLKGCIHDDCGFTKCVNCDLQYLRDDCRELLEREDTTPIYTSQNIENTKESGKNPTLQNIENVNKNEEKMKDNSGDRHE